MASDRQFLKVLNHQNRYQRTLLKLYRLVALVGQEPETNRSESVGDFHNYVGPGLVRDLKVFRTRTEPLGPGPISFGPWIPVVGKIIILL